MSSRPVSTTPVLAFEDAHFNLDKGKVKLGEVLGKGAFSTVYKAKYTGLTIAVKKQKIVDEDLERYIRKELAILRRCNHPGLVRYVGACKLDKETVYIATEYCQGGDLRRLLKSDLDLGWALRIGIACGVADALAYLHARHLIHRDIKTENVLLDEALNPKLCDFGFARDTDTSHTTSKGRPMTMCGTDEFMAPEVIFGMDYNERADVFGFGVVLAELISRKTPGKKEHFLERHPASGFTIDKEELAAVMEECKPPESLALLCQECLADEAPDRPSAEDAHGWLEELTREVGPDDGARPELTERDMLDAVKRDLAQREQDATIDEEVADEDDLSSLSKGDRSDTARMREDLKRATLLALEEVESEADFDDDDDDEEEDDEDGENDGGDAQGDGNGEPLRPAARSRGASGPKHVNVARAAARAAPARAAAARARNTVQGLIREARARPRSERHPTMSGYVVKRGGRIKTWRKRFMIITTQGLVYFKNKDDFTKKPQIIQGSLFFSDMVVPPGQSTVADTVPFLATGRQNSFRVMTNARPRFFQTSDPRLSSKWVRAINLAYSTWCLNNHQVAAAIGAPAPVAPSSK